MEKLSSFFIQSGKVWNLLLSNITIKKINDFFRLTHRKFLLFTAQSEVFYKIFKAHEKEFVITDVNAEIFKEILKFLYTGQIDNTDDENNEKELMKAATKYDIKQLMGHLQLRRNLRNNPLAVKELDNLKNKYDEACYLFEKTKERLSIRNPFHDPPSRYY